MKIIRRNRSASGSFAKYPSFTEATYLSYSNCTQTKIILELTASVIRTSPGTSLPKPSKWKLSLAVIDPFFLSPKFKFKQRKPENLLRLIQLQEFFSASSHLSYVNISIYSIFNEIMIMLLNKLNKFFNNNKKKCNETSC